MKVIGQRWKEAFSDHGFTPSLTWGFLLLVVGLLSQFLSGKYVDFAVGNGTTDIILDHIPSVDLTFLYLYGYFFLIFVFIVAVAAYTPKKTPFVLKTVAIYLFIRSTFTTLTHLGMPAGYIGIEWFAKHDYFFSGHVGFTYLASLLVEKKWLKQFFVYGSIVMALTVLFMHIHYSIDVFAAYFISYSVYRLSGKYFR